MSLKLGNGSAVMFCLYKPHRAPRVLGDILLK